MSTRTVLLVINVVAIAAVIAFLLYRVVIRRRQPDLATPQNLEKFFDDDTLEALKNAAFDDSQMVPTYGEEASFSVGDDGIGVAQVFQGPYWIVAASPVFFEPGDATEIVQSVIDALS